MKFLLTKEFWVWLTGVIPLITSPVGLLIQIRKSYGLKKMGHFSWGMLSLFLVTPLACLFHEILIKAWWMAVKDFAALSCAVTLFTMKLLYDVVRQKGK